MLDIKLIRSNPELVKENIKKKFQDEKLSWWMRCWSWTSSSGPPRAGATSCASSATPSARRSAS